MRAVNLLPETKRRRPGFSGARTPLAVLGAALVLGGLGFWGYSISAEADRVAEQVAVASSERDDLRGQLGAYQQAQARVAAQAVRRGAIVGLAEGRVNWERLIRDVSAVMPRQVWLTNLKGETDAAAITPAGAAAVPNVNNSNAPRGIHLDGFAYTQAQVALLMARVSTVPGLGEPRLATSETQDRGDRTVIHFIIDIPIDQRAQDRPTLTPVSGQLTAATPGVTP